MRSLRRTSSFPALSVCLGTVGVLMVTYIGLIAVVMSYATLTVSFSQSVKNDESAVAMLESRYLISMANIEHTDYLATGYAKPTTKLFVPATSVTALR